MSGAPGLISGAPVGQSPVSGARGAGWGQAPVRTHESRWTPGRILLIPCCVAVLLQLAVLSSHWRFQRDSPMYLSGARSLIEGRGYQYNGAPLTRYAPGFPLILAAVGKLTGMPETLHDSFLCLNGAMALLGVGCVILTFVIIREAGASLWIAFIAALFLSVSRTLIYYSTQLITDVPFTFFGLLALWFGLRMVHSDGARSWAWCAACAAAIVWASAIRPLGPLLAVSVPAGLWLRRDWRQGWGVRLGKTLVIAVCLAVPLLLWSRWTHQVAVETPWHYTQMAFRRNVFWFVVTSPLKLFEHMEGLSDALLGIPLAGVPGFLFLPLFIAGAVRSVRRHERMLSVWVILNWGAIIGCGYALARRYLLPTVPVMIYWLVLGGCLIGSRLLRSERVQNPDRLRTMAIWVAAALFLIPNLARVSKLAYQARSGRFYDLVDGGRGSDYAAITDWLRENANPNAAVLGHETTTLHYFSRLQTVSFPRLRDELTLDELTTLLMRRNIRYIAADEREPEGRAALRSLKVAHPEALEVVAQAGRVELIRVDRSALEAGRRAAAPEPQT